MGNKGHEGVREILEGNKIWEIQGSVGVREIKGKVPSHLQISFPTKKLPSALPHQRTGYIILLCIAKKLPDQRNQVKEN